MITLLPKRPRRCKVERSIWLRLYVTLLLFRGKTYDEITASVQRYFGVTIGRSILSRFYQRLRMQHPVTRNWGT